MTIAPVIAALLPDHQHYVEPYCGSLTVLLAKPLSRMETVNDINQDIVTFWRVLRDQPGDLSRVCSLTPHARAEHASAYEPAPAGDDLEAARRTFVKLTQGRAGQLCRTGWRNYVKPTGSSTSMPGYLAAYHARIGPAAKRLARVSLECMPALDLIARYGVDPAVLLYVDPPYLGSTRRLGRGPYDRYVHDMPDEADHRELAKALHAARAAVVLSGYPSDLYDRELYPGWDRHTIPASTRQGSSSKAERGVDFASGGIPAGTWANRTEVVWSNRPLAVQQYIEGLDLSEAT
jgi:DNA adenine methylase